MSSNNSKQDDLVQKITNNLDKPHRGIVNCGNTCYLNSVLQMLSYMPEFIKTLQSVRDSEYTDKNNGEYKVQSTNKKNATKMLNIFSELYENSKDAYDNDSNISDVLQINDDKGNPTTMNAQQDAEEFLNKLFDKLKIDNANDLTKLPFMKIINREYIECIDKQIKRDGIFKNEAQLMLKLEIPTDNQSYSISTLIKKIATPEKLESPVDGCGGESLVNAEKTTTPMVNENNKYVIIHLKRFKLEKQQFIKIDKEITIDESIKIFDDKGADIVYTLYGFIWHSGSLNLGHYKFFKRVNSTSTFIEYNDDKVKNVSTPENMTRNAYIIVYKRSPATTVAASGEPDLKPEGAAGSTASNENPTGVNSSQTGAKGKLKKVTGSTSTGNPTGDRKPSAPPASPGQSTAKGQGAEPLQQATKRPDEAIRKTKIVTLGSQTYILPIDKENNDFRKFFFTALKSLQDPEEIQEQLNDYLTPSELEILTNTGFYNPRDPQFLIDNAQHMAAFFEALPNCTTDTAVMLDRRCEKSYYLIYALLFNAASQAAEQMKATAEGAMTDIDMLGMGASVDGISQFLRPGKDDAVRQFVRNLIKLRTKGQGETTGYTALLSRALQPPLVKGKEQGEEEQGEEEQGEEEQGEEEQGEKPGEKPNPEFINQIFTLIK